MTKIEFSDSLVQINTVLQQLWQHIRANNAAHDTDTFYICNYCKPRIFNDIVPARCVLNGPKTVALPRVTVHREIFAALSFGEIEIREKYFRESYTCAIKGVA